MRLELVPTKAVGGLDGLDPFVFDVGPVVQYPGKMDVAAYPWIPRRMQAYTLVLTARFADGR